MLMYLSNNTRPDIAYSVHACARYTHYPKKTHATAVKHILRYLKGTSDKGMAIKPNHKEELDCYVDSDFAGLYPVYPDQDQNSTMSRTGYVILYIKGVLFCGFQKCKLNALCQQWKVST